MAILRKREELLPVTCAVLSNEDRSSLFNALRKRSGNKLDRVAAFCGVPVSLVSDWASGRSNVPYHFLQRLCENFNVPMPPVGELRRELQVATDLPSRPVPPLAKHLVPPPPPPRPAPAAPAVDAAPATAPEGPAAAPSAEPETRSSQRPPRAERQDSGRKPRRGRERKPQRAQRQEPARENRPSQPGSFDPKYSELAAYWTAVVLTAGRVEADTIVLALRGGIGRDYLDTWADQTHALFGLKPELVMGEDGDAREARLPTQDLQKFLDRAGVKPGGLPSGGAPRWVWSNAQWRTAFVRGVVDAAAQLDPAQSLVIERLPEELRRALKKMLSALDLESKDAPEGGLTLEGPDTVQRYFRSVGADNLRLRDQLKARFGDVMPADSPSLTSGTPEASTQNGTPAAGSHERTPGSRRRGRGRRGRGRRGDPNAAAAPQGAAAPGNGNPQAVRPDSPQASEPMDDPETTVDIGNEALPVREPSDEQPPAPPTPFMEE